MSAEDRSWIIDWYPIQDSNLTLFYERVAAHFTVSIEEAIELVRIAVYEN